MKILIVDDEHDIVSLFRQQFRSELHSGAVSFVFAHSAEEALAVLEQQSEADIVLILSDINMPGMNGLELLRLLKEHSPNRPVVMITAYDNPENQQAAAERGADSYLAKPLDFLQLRRELARLGAVQLAPAAAQA